MEQFSEWIQSAAAPAYQSNVLPRPWYVCTGAVASAKSLTALPRFSLALYIWATYARHEDPINNERAPCRTEGMREGKRKRERERERVRGRERESERESREAAATSRSGGRSAESSCEGSLQLRCHLPDIALLLWDGARPGAREGDGTHGLEADGTAHRCCNERSRKDYRTYWGAISLSRAFALTERHLRLRMGFSWVFSCKREWERGRERERGKIPIP